MTTLAGAKMEYHIAVQSKASSYRSQKGGAMRRFITANLPAGFWT
jgi:hypothetical protein